MVLNFDLKKSYLAFEVVILKAAMDKAMEFNSEAFAKYFLAGISKVIRQFAFILQNEMKISSSRTLKQ